MLREPLIVADRRRVASLLAAIKAAGLTQPSTAYPSHRLVGFVDFVLHGEFYTMGSLYEGEDLDSFSVLDRAMTTAWIVPSDPDGREAQQRRLLQCDRRFVSYDPRVALLHESLFAPLPLAA